MDTWYSITGMLGNFLQDGTFYDVEYVEKAKLNRVGKFENVLYRLIIQTQSEQL